MKHLKGILAILTAILLGTNGLLCFLLPKMGYEPMNGSGYNLFILVLSFVAVILLSDYAITINNNRS